MSLRNAVARAITQTTGKVFRATERRSVHGGDINIAEILEGDGQRYFVKSNDAARLGMFEALSRVHKVIETLVGHGRRECV